MAAVACKEFQDVNEAAAKLVKVKETVLPTPGLWEKYDRRYRVFCEIYPALKPVYARME